MRVHIERNRLMQTVDIYVVMDNPRVWLEYVGPGAIDSVEVPEGTEGPAFLTLPEYVWEGIVRLAPDPEESFVRGLLSREQDRVDKLIDNALKD